MKTSSTTNGSEPTIGAAAARSSSSVSRCSSSVSRASSARLRRSTAARFSSTAPSSWRRRARSSSAAVSADSRSVRPARKSVSSASVPRGRTCPSAASVRRTRAIPEQLLAPLELGDRLAEARGMLVELGAAPREELLEPSSALGPGLRTRRTKPPPRASSFSFWSGVVMSACPLPGTPTDRS